MKIFDVEHRWVHVEVAAGVHYAYPMPVSPQMVRLCNQPAVYRWALRNSESYLKAMYVGETDNLVRRIKQYLQPGNTQTTNLRLKACFDETIQEGGKIEIQTLRFEPFQINGAKFSSELLRHTHLRRVLENLVLLWLQVDPADSPPIILNRVLAQDAERAGRRVSAASRDLKALGLTVEQAQRLLQELKIAPPPK